MEYGFPWLEVAGLLLPGVFALAGVWYRLHSQIIGVDKALADYKLQVAKEYATTSAIKEVEERVVQAIDRLGDRLDKFLDQRHRNGG
jgi:basic membrane lipoprotein Med (substrate-binding protein (PBP1-ABC) superfamily)